MAFVGMLVALSCAMALDASRRRDRFEATRPQAREATRMLGFANLALSSSARWLRVPTLTERTAPLCDAPIAFDTDPAGGILGPIPEAHGQ